jgi:hypothetical protein
MKAAVGVLVCLAIAGFAGWLLFSGSALLDVELPFAFPAGNIAAAVMLVALAAIPVLSSAPGSRLRAVAKATLVAAIAWLPVSMAIAGGMQLHYSGWQSWLWMTYTLALLLAVPVVFGWAIVAALLQWRRRAVAAR